MPAPLSKAVLEAIRRAALSNAAKRRVMQAASAKVSQREDLEDPNRP